jgi:hypothetical protein
MTAAAKGCRPNKESAALMDKLFSLKSTSRGDRCPYFSWKRQPEDCGACLYYNVKTKECQHPEAPRLKVKASPGGSISE